MSWIDNILQRGTDIYEIYEKNRTERKKVTYQDEPLPKASAPQSAPTSSMASMIDLNNNYVRYGLYGFGALVAVGILLRVTK